MFRSMMNITALLLTFKLMMIITYEDSGFVQKLDARTMCIEQ